MVDFVIQIFFVTAVAASVRPTDFRCILVRDQLNPNTELFDSVIKNENSSETNILRIIEFQEG